MVKPTTPHMLDHHRFCLLMWENMPVLSGVKSVYTDPLAILNALTSHHIPVHVRLCPLNHVPSQHRKSNYLSPSFSGYANLLRSTEYTQSGNVRILAYMT
jgi:hypothetical protein